MNAYDIAECLAELHRHGMTDRMAIQNDHIVGHTKHVTTIWDGEQELAVIYPYKDRYAAVTHRASRAYIANTRAAALTNLLDDTA